MLEQRPDKIEKFRDVLNVIFEKYQCTNSLPRDFVALADRFEWPDWATECLPSLLVLTSIRSDSCIFLAWRPIVRFLETRIEMTNQWRSIRPWCNGMVIEIEATQETYKDLAERVAPAFEKLRIDSPYSSAGARRGVVLEALSFLEDEDRVKGRTAEANSIALLREEILREEGVGFSPGILTEDASNSLENGRPL
jgi:hypothetical protein